MLRFHRRPSASFQPPRAVRGKLWMYVGLLGLVYFLTTKAADPRTWFWITPEANGMQGADGQLEENVLTPSRPPERPPGAFQAAADERPAADPAAPAKGNRPLFPGVREDLLRDLRDDDFFRPREHEAFFHLLKVLQDTDDATLAAASSGHVVFAQLFRQPDSYRGEVVTVRGAAVRCNLRAAPPNEFGIAEYYEVWLQPDDNPTYPMKAYALTAPPDFPNGNEIKEPIDVTGFFYRRIAYKAQDEPRTTPLVLARGLAWRREEVSMPGDDAATYFSAIAAVVTVLLVALVFFLTRGKSPRRPTEAPERGSLDALRNLELAPGPAAALREVAEQMDRDEPADAILRPPGGHFPEGR